jgi:hypothetical protein
MQFGARSSLRQKPEILRKSSPRPAEQPFFTIVFESFGKCMPKNANLLTLARTEHKSYFLPFLLVFFS